MINLTIRHQMISSIPEFILCVIILLFALIFARYMISEIKEGIRDKDLSSAVFPIILLIIVTPIIIFCIYRLLNILGIINIIIV